jgi:hypothetical protein
MDDGVIKVVELTPDYLKNSLVKKVDTKPNHNIGRYSVISSSQYAEGIECRWASKLVTHWDAYIGEDNAITVRLFRCPDGYGAVCVKPEHLVAEVKI